ncbi:MAG: 16S rRNA (guanine(527)-N(7))-methyltransferase RsmG [Acidobacteriia bacterium]|nr:16S rRNA (guanine(527)-N(7))-methyltransferase RsmG [Terriglobia bacterium]
MDTARIAALLEPFLDQPLPARALEQISIYIDLLLRWNARINLTAIRDPEEIVTRHFGESLFLARHLFPENVARAFLPAKVMSESQSPGAPLIAQVAMSGPPPQAPRVLDLGSGAGFPALPIKIRCPNIHLTLIESNHKKAAFLRETARSLTLTNVNIITERAETLVSKGPPQADVVTLRAVERFDTALPLAIKFLAPAARIALLIGSSRFPTLHNLALTIDWQHPISIPRSHSRILAIGLCQ